MRAEHLPEERYHYSFNRSLEAVKAAVSVIDEADLLCGPAGQRTGLRRVGERWVGLCPLPDHDEKTPSFTVFPDDHWWCFGCNRGGDVLDLHQLAHGYTEKWEALVSLARARGVELPGRSQSWHEASVRKGEVHELAARVRGAVYKRRAFALLVEPVIEKLPDPEERDEERARAWREFGSPEQWKRIVEDWLFAGENVSGRT